MGAHLKAEAWLFTKLRVHGSAVRARHAVLLQLQHHPNLSTSIEFASGVGWFREKSRLALRDYREETASATFLFPCRVVCSKHGRCSVNVLPRPGALLTVRWPFIASTILFARGNPKPVP